MMAGLWPHKTIYIFSISSSKETIVGCHTINVRNHSSSSTLSDFNNLKYKVGRWSTQKCAIACISTHNQSKLKARSSRSLNYISKSPLIKLFKRGVFTIIGNGFNPNIRNITEVHAIVVRTNVNVVCRFEEKTEALSIPQ